MGHARFRLWLARICRIAAWPFRTWTALDCLSIGIAALGLALIAQHAFGLELGYAILSWSGSVFVIVGLWRVFVQGED